MTLWTAQPWFLTLAVDWVDAGVIALCVLAALLALTLWGLFVWAGWIGLQRKQQAVFPLRLTSRGNVQAPIRLRVELGGLKKSVSAVWLQDGRRLPEQTLKHYTYVQEALPAKVAAPAKAVKTVSRSKKESKEAKAAREGAQKVSGIANLVASITGTLASLLPGPLKAPFKAVNAAIREQQKGVSQVKAQADQVKSGTRSLEHNVKRLGKATGVKPAGGNGAATGQAGGDEPVESGQRVVVTEIPVTETLPFSPAESAVCKLVIRPKNPLRSVSGPVEVAAQPVESKEFPLYGVMPSRALLAELNIRARALHRVLFAALFVAAGAVCALGAVTLIEWLLIFRS